MAKTISGVVNEQRGEQSMDDGRQGFFDVGWPPAVADKDFSTARVDNYRLELGKLRQDLSRAAAVKSAAKEAGTTGMDLLSVDPLEDLLLNFGPFAQLGNLTAPVSSALNYTGLGAMAAPALQAAAPYLGPIGLAAWFGTMALAGVSAYKTHKHIRKLSDIYTRREHYSPPNSCVDLTPLVRKVRILANDKLSREEKQRRMRSTTPALVQTRENESRYTHLFILDNVLPYIISKKESKFGRKLISAGGLGLTEGLRAPIKGLYKYLRGTKGEHREGAAAWIAYHWMQHECVLCYDIALELWGKRAEQMRF